MKTNRFKIYHITIYWVFSLRNPSVELGLSFAYACTTIKLLFFEISFWHMHSVHDHYYNLDLEQESLKKYDHPLTEKLFKAIKELGYEDNRVSIGMEMMLESDKTLEIETNIFLSKELTEEESKTIKLAEEAKFNMQKAKEEYEKLKWYQKVFPQLAPPKIYEN